MGLQIKFIRSIREADETGLYLTNYETVRDGKLDPKQFLVTSLDEAACLRAFGGSKTYREFMRLFDGVPYRFVATATPDPNEYIELLAYAAYLGIMDVAQAKTRFFKRDSTKADKLTIHPHKEVEFWLWVSSWALFLQKPSDLGYDDAGYDLPEMEVIYHEVSVDHTKGQSFERDGQQRMFRESLHGIVDAAREKRDTLPERIECMKQILAAEPDEHFLIWHDLEAEREAIEDCFSEDPPTGGSPVSPRKVGTAPLRDMNAPDEPERGAIPTNSSHSAEPVETRRNIERSARTKRLYASAYGNQDIEERERNMIDFAEGRLQYLGGKPVQIGAGGNYQRHCARAIFLGIGFKFADFIQACMRICRYLQPRPVKIHIIYAESERRVLENLLEKWARYKERAAKMSQIIQEHGLSQQAMMTALQRSLGVERVEVKGENYSLVCNDAVEEIQWTAGNPGGLDENSVDLILTSIPFGTQYEYSPCYEDFGHSESNSAFFRQMDFLTPHLLRVLKPGRLACIHVKDRIVPGGVSGLGCGTVYPFHVDTIINFTRHGFAYMGMKTIVTDVVRENNQTYRLGWTEQCKDGTKMGVGMPEYLLIFRKPQTDSTRSYADTPVVKLKRKYSRSRWQIDAHGFMRSNGNRLLTPEDLEGLPHHTIFKLFREFSLEQVYNFEHHVKLGEALEAKGILPVTFMLLQPQSWHPDVWTDITRMRTLNGAQSAKGKEMHLCPMQFDLADRVIEQYSMEGELVFDPFGGLMSVPYRAILKGRKALGIELNHRYFLDGCAYVEAAARNLNMPGLFDGIAGEMDLPEADIYSKDQTTEDLWNAEHGAGISKALIEEELAKRVEVK